MAFGFDLVADSGEFGFADRGWDKIRFHLLEFQPAKEVALLGEPPSRFGWCPAETRPGSREHA